MSGIFICYRQDDAKPWALLLRDELADAFGEENVFLDKDTLHAGSWREQIQQALGHCKVVVVVIGRRWLTITDPQGQRRLDNPSDVHRQEVAMALSRKDVTVIPVRVDGAPMPGSEDLPDDIRSLTDQQSRELSDRGAHRELDVKALVTDIERATGQIAKQHAPSSSISSQGPQRQSARSLFSIWTVLVVAVASVVLLVIAEVGLQAELDVQEKSFVVFIVLLITMGGAWFRNYVKGDKDDKT